MDREIMEQLIEEKKEVFESISDQIWEFAEIQFEEVRSSVLQMQVLRENGFRITSPLGGLPTAFLAEYGEGRPVIGILGEYDALINMSQVCDLTERVAVVPNAPGHGCGHNLLGTAGVEAVVAVKAFMEREHLRGTIRYYGCPAEEIKAGKTILIQEGCFSDVDICLSWHPSISNGLFNSALAVTTARFHFTGKSAHAAVAPYRGRSALDAMELMNVGANYLREHVIPEARIHYAIVKTGGEAPNIVQAEAESLYNIRAPKFSDCAEIYERVCNVARGAALMTGTEVDIQLCNTYMDFLDNNTLDDLLLEKMEQFVPQTFLEEELAYAKRFQAIGNMPGDPEPISTTVIKDKHRGPYASTDVGNVSWIVPTGQVYIACFAKGSTLHGWNVVAQGKSCIAHHGMHTAAKVLGSSAVELLRCPELVERAKRDFDKARRG